MRDAPNCGQAQRAWANLSNIVCPHLNIYSTKFGRGAQFPCDSWPRGVGDHLAAWTF